MHYPEHAPYMRLTERQRVDKAVHTLTGLLRGIAIDDKLNALEIAEVLNWCNEYRQFVDRAPFKELIQKLDEMMSDGVIDPEEQEDLLWVCKNLSPDSEYYDEITHEIQVLQGILHGIMADDHISVTEATELQHWINDHAHLKGTYPYDELESLLMVVLADGAIEEEEQKMLREFFEDFIQYSLAKRVQNETKRVRSGLTKSKTLPAICAVCPELEFDARTFTFTGSSMKAKRAEIAKQVERLGGIFNPKLTQKTDFLVVGAGGNPCWAFSCYGRKVEKAAELRKEGHAITIVHESDFWDALADHQ
jgi:NAD-dependent DNA ligase